MAGHIVDLDADHPGFHDPEYRRRRDAIATMAPPFGSGLPPRVVEYTEAEVDTWRTVWSKLTELYPSHACREFCDVIDAMGYRADRIPQLADVSRFLTDATGFRLQPVAGLVSAR